MESITIKVNGKEVPAWKDSSGGIVSVDPFPSLEEIIFEVRSRDDGYKFTKETIRIQKAIKKPTCDFLPHIGQMVLQKSLQRVFMFVGLESGWKDVGADNLFQYDVEAMILDNPSDFKSLGVHTGLRLLNSATEWGEFMFPKPSDLEISEGDGMPELTKLSKIKITKEQLINSLQRIPMGAEITLPPETIIRLISDEGILSDAIQYVKENQISFEKWREEKETEAYQLGR